MSKTREERLNKLIEKLPLVILFLWIAGGVMAVCVAVLLLPGPMRITLGLALMGHIALEAMALYHGMVE